MLGGMVRRIRCKGKIRSSGGTVEIVWLHRCYFLERSMGWERHCGRFVVSREMDKRRSVPTSSFHYDSEDRKGGK